ncbi:SRPBCC domain-containing protein [Paenibacillaceae bacterium WGS1546]|uniref:SRPBCC domain-containing protein n=1 Tax=Cohnella sp. WGS1546 TaxID=3366810 RepID=UPI00372D3E91
MSNLQVVYEIHIRATADQIWNALTNGEETVHWCYGSPIVSDWMPGSKYAYMTPDKTIKVIAGNVLEIDPGKRVTMDYRMLSSEEVAKDKPSREIWEIEPAGEICKLRVTHDTFEGETTTYHRVKDSTPWMFSSLKSYLETGKGFGYPAS